ncbi:DinB family protein [Compostibacter hankyongensis]|uniref:DinB family protein n=1 Tax=Compostibacter hankyongensis TaxID=1007089 RepID=A0ABP8G996_9BACT
MDQPVSKSLEIIIPAFRMHTQMFDNILAGVETKDVLKRIEGRTNHIVWMAGNLVNCRYWLAGILGIAETDPNSSFFENARALDEKLDYPSLDVLKKEWHTISPKLYKRLLSISEEELHEPYAFGMKVEFVTENKLNMVGMATDRVGYLFGQLGLMRRILGYEGVRYDINEKLNY